MIPIGRSQLTRISGIFMFVTLLVVGCLGAVAGQGDFESYLAEHKSFGKAVAAMICLYGKQAQAPFLDETRTDRQCSPSTWLGGLSPGLCE